MNAPSLTSLLIRWEEAHTEGISLSAAELCIDSPHLIPELQKAIDALQAMQHLIGTKATSAPVAAESWATIFPPEGRTNLASDQIFSPSSANQTPAPAGYEVLEELGRGGMGVVYKARQRTLNRLCALKVILDAGHADTDQRVRFLIEAEAIARIKHPGIVQIYDFGTYGGLPYFSMELCENGSLADRLRHGPLTAREASAIVENVARAVHAAHESGIVHRDLKPGNVLLAADGSPRVTDFGLAKRTYTEGHTQTGAVMGTPSYMAPEQAGGKKEIGPAVDVWALGAILYEGLSGRPPFGAATPLDTLMQVIDDEPVTLRQLNKKVPVDLETICHKCLHKIPAKRYQSAGALAEDLNRWLTNEPISARPVGTTERVLRWVKKRPAIAGLAALLAVLTIGSMMVILSFYRDASEQARIAGQERETALEAETRARTAQGEAEGQRDHAELRTQMSQYAFRLAQIQRELAGKGLSESGISRASSLFEQCSQPLRGWEYEHLRLQLGHRVFLQKKNPPHEDRVQSICYSRDGRSIVTSTTRQIRVWDAVTGRVEKTLDAGKSRIKSVHLSPDGRWLACGGHAYDEEGNEFNEEKEHDAPLIMTRGVFDKGMRARAVVMVWDLNNKERQPRKLEVKGKSIVAVRFAPDGSWLASAGSEKTVWIWDVDSWKRQPKEIIAPESVDCLEIHPGGNLLALGSNKQVLLYDRATGKVLHTLTGHQGVINRVSFSGDGRLLASADLADGLVHVWDTTTGKRLRSLGDKAAGTAVSIAFAPGKRAVLACGFTDPSGYTLVDADSGTTLGRVRSSHLAAEGVVFSPDAKRLAFTTLEGVGSVPMNSLGSKPVWLEDESLALLNQRFSEADKKCAPEMLLSASSVEVRANAPANSFSVIEKETGLPLAEFRTFPIDAGKPLPIQTPGGLVRVETRPDAILIRNSRTKSVQLLFPSLSEDKYRVAFTSDRTRMVSLANRTVKLWDTAKQNC